MAETITRLLLQKETPYAELQDNARIAVSVLQDDGWDVQRIGLQVAVTATPYIEMTEANDLSKQLVAAQNEKEALYWQVAQSEKELAVHWSYTFGFVGFVAAAIALLGTWGRSGWGFIIGGIFALISYALKYVASRTKGAA